MAKKYFVYILTNFHNNVLYTGVTNNIWRRVQEYKFGKGGKFTAKYNVNKLVYVEVYEYIYDAITREKQIKGGSRQDKIDLITSTNPEWSDLLDEI